MKFIPKMPEFTKETVMTARQRIGGIALLALLFASFAGMAATDWSGDLSPIAKEDWNAERAAHLLERAGFGGTPEEIARFAATPPSGYAS